MDKEPIPVTAQLPLQSKHMKFVPADFIAYKTIFTKGWFKEGDHMACKFWHIGFLNFSAN